MISEQPANGRVVAALIRHERAFTAHILGDDLANLLHADLVDMEAAHRAATLH